MSAKFIEPSHHLADRDHAARKLIEIANAVEAAGLVSRDQTRWLQVARVSRPRPQN